MKGYLVENRCNYSENCILVVNNKIELLQKLLDLYPDIIDQSIDILIEGLCNYDLNLIDITNIKIK